MKIKRLPLTKTEEKVWAYLLGYITDNQYAPTRQEVAIKMGFGSRQMAQFVLSNLERKGRIKLVGRGWRNIQLQV